MNDGPEETTQERFERLGREWKRAQRRFDRLPLGWYLFVVGIGVVLGSAVTASVMLLVRRCP